MNKRKQLIKDIAEEMARAYFPGNPEEHPESFEGAVLHKLKYAHIAVARIEGAVAFALCENGIDFDKAVHWMDGQGFVSDQQGDLCECTEEGSVIEEKDGTLRCFQCGKLYPPYKRNIKGMPTKESAQEFLNTHAQTMMEDLPLKIYRHLPDLMRRYAEQYYKTECDHLYTVVPLDPSHPNHERVAKCVKCKFRP